ncbi:cytochrome c-type biogenesis protein [Variovorax sp.]|uniref:cytochrome c-type biogenesis protein n=1 Tax=Variovorax sp. TaxID=1871043 RepID=UPI002D3E21A7|nr:cytochrome c-type biogenesis protein [Variovorax sp.]HYP83104.1 cytochrome c-type biogenesis protein [Variovorax sp.]
MPRAPMVRLPSAVLAALAALSVAQAAATLDDAALDARAHALEQQLRCVVCQNQSLAESNAPLAQDLRQRVREQLRNGADEEAIKRYMVERYGDFVLYAPPVRPVTWMLWFGPPILLAAIAALLLRRSRRRRGGGAPLSADERAKLQRLLQHDGVAARERVR